MDQFLYLIWSLTFLGAAALIYAAKPSLRSKMASLAAFGAGLGYLLDHAFYFRDYWQPPMLWERLPFESMLSGFAAGALIPALYDLLPAERKPKKEMKDGRALYGTLFALGVAALFIGNRLLGINSIAISLGVALSAAAALVTWRPDLARRSLVSGALAVAAMIPLYFVLFGILSPEYWDRYWLLAGTAYDLRLVPYLPLTEIAWYFAWGILGGISWEVVAGRH